MSGRPGSLEVLQDGVPVSLDVHSLDFDEDGFSVTLPTPSTDRGAVAIALGGEIALAADGAAHLFVNPVGNDSNTGLTAATAFQTINRALARLNSWLLLGVNADIVIELAAGIYAQNVHVALARIPLGRVIIRGPEVGTVIASGVVGPGPTASVIADAGAAFVANAEAGRFIRVFDPLNIPATDQQKVIRTNGATTINPANAFSPIPVAGQTYQVLEPSVRIIGDPAFPDQPVFSVDLPFQGSALGVDGTLQNDGSGGFIVAFVAIARVGGTTTAVRIRSGKVIFVGVMTDGDSTTDAMDLFYTTIMTGIFALTADTVFGLTAFSLRLFDCALGLRGTSYSSVLRGDHLSFTGTVVVRVPAGGTDGILGFFCQFNLFGGALHGRQLDIDEESTIFIDNGFDAALPFLVRGLVGTACRIRKKSQAYVGVNGGTPGLRFEAITGNAILVDEDSYARLLGVTAPAVGGISGLNVLVDNHSKVRITAANITDALFPGGGGATGSFMVDGASFVTWAFATIREDAAGATTRRSVLFAN